MMAGIGGFFLFAISLIDVVLRLFRNAGGGFRQSFSKFVPRASRGIAVLIGCALLIGCAEVNYRGGFLAQIADKVVFPASAKGHRVLRSYTILAALVTIANNRGIPSGDKLAFQGRVYQTLDSIQQSFICAYATTSGCIFFDEKMARVSYNLYKLALNVLVSSESKALITELQGELLPKVPVVGSTLLAASSAAETAGHVATAGVETAQVVESLIKLGYQATNTLGPLFPLYRDAQELDMVVVVDMLARRCAANGGLMASVTHDANPFRDNLVAYGGKSGLPQSADCVDFATGMGLYKSGNGYLKDWRTYTNDMSLLYLADMTPSGDHFLEVSSMIKSACKQMFTTDGLSVQPDSTTAAAVTCASAVLYSGSASGTLATAEASATKLAYHAAATGTPVASSTGSSPVADAKAKVSTIPLN